MNINCHLNNKNSQNLPKEEFKLKQHTKSGYSQGEETILKCPKCSENAKLMCYACCLEISCIKCHDYQHFASCKKQYNKFSFSLENNQGNGEIKSKKNKKIQNSIQKCKRCQSFCQEFQYCQTCKISVCLKCSTQMHSKGKFNNHVRMMIFELEKRDKKLITMVSQIQEPEQSMMRKSKRQNIENNEYGLKGKNKSKIPPATPTSHKRQKSISKSNKNQDNNMTNLRKSKKSQNINIVDIAELCSSIDIKVQHSWLNCKNHNKIRTILTQNYDLICQFCYDELKPNMPNLQKKKSLDIQSFLKHKNLPSQLKQTLNQTTIELNLKINELNQQFKTYKQELSREYYKNMQMLEQKYKQNAYNIQKWEKNYQQNLKGIINQYQSVKFYEQLARTVENSISDNQLYNIASLKVMIALEEGHKMKRDCFQQLQQYYFKVSCINSREFQDLIKSFNFARRKTQFEGNQQTGQKSLSKISQSNPLKQSRISNASITSDRKNLRRQDSLLKSGYYQLSSNNNLIKRNLSKQIRQDISQKILFPNNLNNNLKNDKKQIIKKIQSKNQSIRHSQYFFDNINDSRNKTTIHSKKQIIAIPNIAFKDVKYIDLQNFMTQKTDKEAINTQQESFFHQLSTKTYDQQQSNDRQAISKQNDKSQLSKDSKITYSINASNTQLYDVSQKNIQSLANSVVNVASANTSVCNKTKRKSDYMEMRDRLRKPNYLNKLK